MKLFPAIDMHSGKAVRLLRGDYSRMAVYSDDTLSIARDFETAGARYVHLVDLEGAKSGTTPGLENVRAIAKGTSLFIEIGGGIRNMKAVEAYLSAGASRVILGTAAVEDGAFLKEAVATCGERIAVGVDIRDGFVAIHGWTKNSGIDCFEFCDRMKDTGVKTLICTDISKDGAMQGTNRALYKRLGERYDMDIVASGGVSSIDDIVALRQLGIYGAIIGKAYYTRAIDLREALEAAK